MPSERCTQGVEEWQVPLSEEEQKILEQIEAELSREDPDFVRQVEETSVFRVSLKSLVKAGVGLLVGMVLIFVGLVSGSLLVSVAGFGICVAAALAGAREALKMGKAAQETLHSRMTGWMARRAAGSDDPLGD